MRMAGHLRQGETSRKWGHFPTLRLLQQFEDSVPAWTTYGWRRYSASGDSKQHRKKAWKSAKRVWRTKLGPSGTTSATFAADLARGSEVRNVPLTPAPAIQDKALFEREALPTSEVDLETANSRPSTQPNNSRATRPSQGTEFPTVNSPPSTSANDIFQSSHPDEAQAPFDAQRKASKAHRSLALICTDFKAAVASNRAPAAERHLQAYLEGGGAPVHWMFDALINLYARRRRPAAALAIKERMLAHGLQPTLYNYNSLLNAVSKSSMTGYNLGDEAVSSAEALLSEIRSSDLALDRVSYVIIMDIYAKAGRFDSTVATFEEMKMMGFGPDVKAFNALLEACKRSNRAWFAAHLLKEVMPAAGIAPDTQAWNTLLGAFGRNGDIDGTYNTWQEMMNRGVKPDAYTEMEIAEAFSSSPDFASELISQARRFRELLEASTSDSDTSSTASNTSSASSPTTATSGVSLDPHTSQGVMPNAVKVAAFQMENWLAGLRLGNAHAPGYMSSWLLFGDIQNPYWLDLHRMSQATARAAILERLHYLLEHLPTEEVDAWHNAIIANEVGFTRGGVPGLTRSSNNTRAHDVNQNSKEADTSVPNHSSTDTDARAQAGPSVSDSRTSARLDAAASTVGATASSSNVEVSGREAEEVPRLDKGHGHELRESTEGSGARDLIVLVGRGKHSPDDGRTGGATNLTRMKAMVLELCESLHLKCEEVPGNSGRMLIPHAELLALAARSTGRGEEVAMMRRVRKRLAVLTLFGFGVTACMSSTLWLNTLQALFERG